MNIFDLNQSNCTLLSSWIRQTIADRLGKNPHDYLWRDMRRCADIPDQRHLLTEYQGWLLFSVGVFYAERGILPTRQVENQNGELVTEFDTLTRNRFSNQFLQAFGDPSQMFNALGSHVVTKAELLEIIEAETGKRPCDRTLRNWRSKVAPSRRWKNGATYTLEQVRRILYAAQQSSCRRAA